jgi:hypothetical protein
MRRPCYAAPYLGNWLAVDPRQVAVDALSDGLELIVCDPLRLPVESSALQACFELRDGGVKLQRPLDGGELLGAATTEQDGVGSGV